MGWLAGVAYQIPEIALKASVTYRSEIKHEMTTYETSDSRFPSHLVNLTNVNCITAKT